MKKSPFLQRVALTARCLGRGALPTRLAAVLVCGLAAAACAAQDSETAGDPLEPVNRVVFNFNHALDRHAALPAASFYRSSVPEGVRIGFHNFISNLNEPVTIVNDTLQADFDHAGDAAARFALNTTLGVCGILDVATDRGFPDRPEDFGITLGKYGVPGGPYLVLPLMGPENLRDFSARFADSYFEPTRYVSWDGKAATSLTLRGVAMLDQRSQHISILRDIERSSVDYYATTRSIYEQSRRNRIMDGAPSAEDSPPY